MDDRQTVLVVEHHLAVIKCLDWVMDLGPCGGESSGHNVVEGSPEEIANSPTSITGKFLKTLLALGR